LVPSSFSTRQTVFGHSYCHKPLNFLPNATQYGVDVEGRLAIWRFTPISDQPVQGIVQTIDAN